jgi:hypothetical protein
MSRRTFGSIASDVRALGGSAPLRAAYEASKRSGFHGVLFRESKARRGDSSTAFRLCAPDQIGPQARNRCLEDAAAILDEGLRVFGRRVDTGVRGNWSLDPLTGKNWPEGQAWWEIDIRSGARLSDVKFVWEAGRHRDLVVLARAAYLDPDGRWLGGLTGLLESWCDENAPERGVHWYSSLELALRAIAWAQVLQLVGDRLPLAVQAAMDRQLRASARHLLVELPYTLSSMRNNHLLGDALGLLVLARLFPQAPGARRWTSIGNRLFGAQLARHMRADGSMIEDSLSYHRFVLEMLVVRVLLGDAPSTVAEALRGAGLHLRALLASDGTVPQFGDWDEGRVLTSSGDALDVAGSTALALALTSGDVPADAWDRFDELAWYAPPPAAVPATSSVPSEASSGGITRAERGPFRVWFKVDAGPSHGHADLTSVWVQKDGRWTVADPGTGTYNGPLEVRNGFRTSSAHPVRRPGNRDQLVPHRAFRWLRKARGFSALPLSLDGHTVLFGWHDAYEADLPGLKVGRAVVVADDYVAVVEFASTPSEPVREWSLTVPLHPASSPADVFGLDQADAVAGSGQPFAGWFSRTYGHWEPATWLLTDRAPKVWGVGTEPQWSEAGAVAIDGLVLEADWTASAGSLHVTERATGKRHEMRAE